METVWGTSVSIDGYGVLLRGPSGAGKSDLALRVIDRVGGKLIADDRTRLAREGNALVASPPDEIAGRLEVRGVGIVDVEHVTRAPLMLVVDLVPPEQVQRMPEPGDWQHAGVSVPLIALAAFEASTPIKLKYALSKVIS